MDPAKQTGPFAERARALAGYRGLSKLKNRAYNLDVRGTSTATFDSVMRGRAQPPAVLMESVAAILDVDPRVFDEYRCYLARRRLSPIDAGLAQATGAADMVLVATPETAGEKRERAAHAAERAAQRLRAPRPTDASDRRDTRKKGRGS